MEQLEQFRPGTDGSETPGGVRVRGGRTRRSPRQSGRRRLLWLGLSLALTAALVAGVLFGPSGWSWFQNRFGVNTVRTGNGTDGAAPLLVVAPPGAAPGADAVTTQLTAVQRVALGDVNAVVVDARTGSSLYQEGRTVAMPASTMKVVTCGLALDVFGAGKRFDTTVVRHGDGYVLVGGGDPYLAADDDPQAYPDQASLAELATIMARTLQEQNIAAITLGYDSSLFVGDSWHPDWKSNYGAVVSGIGALWADQGKQRKPFSQDDDLAAAQILAQHLAGHGISAQVTGRTRTGIEDAQIASISSMPLERIVQQVMLASDNRGAEVLFRHLALSQGKPASFEGGVQAVEALLRAAQMWVDGTVVRDGSGLSRSNRIAPAMLANLIRKAMDEPRLHVLLRAMPVAHATGTLSTRFSDDAAQAGRGIVRGKTGYLNGTYSLAGYLRTECGAILIYAILVNDSPSDLSNATSTEGEELLFSGPKKWLDDTVAGLATCGC